MMREDDDFTEDHVIEAWVWFWHRFYSWSVTRGGAAGELTFYRLQSRNDGRIFAFLKIFDFPFEKFMGRAATEYAARLRAAMNPIWPATDLTPKDAFSPLTLPMTMRRFNTETEVREIRTTWFRQNVMLLTTQVPSNPAQPSLQQPIIWREDLPSETPL